MPVLLLCSEGTPPGEDTGFSPCLQNGVRSKENPFKYEKAIQAIVENNLGPLFGLQLVRTEFSLGGLRIDTLAFDKDAQAFVILEFKKGSNYSVVDQGMSYLGLMLNNKAEFILEYNERCNGSLKRDDVDWSQSKVLFISPSFTPFQLEAINFKDLPIELWEIRRYANNTLRLDQHKPTSAVASIKTVSKKSDVVDAISREVKTYTEEGHLKAADHHIADLYARFKDLVLSISPDIAVKPMKQYIAFRTKTNVTDVVVLKKSLKVFFNLPKGKLDDPKKLARDVSEVGHWGNGDYQVQFSTDNDLEYIISLVRQSYKANS
jgi:predicted transport protein